MWAAVGELMERAKAQGTMRADVTPADLRVLWGGRGAGARRRRGRRPAEWRRYAALALGALRACD